MAHAETRPETSRTPTSTEVSRSSWEAPPARKATSDSAAPRASATVASAPRRGIARPAAARRGLRGAATEDNGPHAGGAGDERGDHEQREQHDERHGELAHGADPRSAALPAHVHGGPVVHTDRRAPRPGGVLDGLALLGRRRRERVAATALVAVAGRRAEGRQAAAAGRTGGAAAGPAAAVAA